MSKPVASIVYWGSSNRVGLVYQDLVKAIDQTEVEPLLYYWHGMACPISGGMQWYHESRINT